MFPVSCLAYIIECVKYITIRTFRNQGIQFCLGPYVVFSFFAFTVGVKGTIKSSRWIEPIFRRKRNGLFDHIKVLLVSSPAKSLSIEGYQLAIVIQHLFKVGNQPVGIGGVSCETTFNLIINTSHHHAIQCHLNQFLCHGIIVPECVMHQVLPVVRHRKFRCTTAASHMWIRAIHKEFSLKNGIFGGIRLCS